MHGMWIVKFVFYSLSSLRDLSLKDHARFTITKPKSQSLQTEFLKGNKSSTAKSTARKKKQWSRNPQNQNPGAPIVYLHHKIYAAIDLNVMGVSLASFFSWMIEAKTGRRNLLLVVKDDDVRRRRINAKKYVVHENIKDDGVDVMVKSETHSCTKWAVGFGGTSNRTGSSEFLVIN